MIALQTGTYLGNNKKSFSADGVVISQTEYTQKVFEGWHAHENTHLTFFVTGGNREQRKNKETEALPGALLFYHSGEAHRNTHTHHPSKNLNLEIEPYFFNRYGIAETSFDPQLLHSARVKLQLLKIYHTCTTAEGTAIAVHSLLLSLIKDMEVIKSVNPPHWIKEIQAIIEDRWNENVTLNELAAAVNVHPVTISKNFPRYTGGTLSDYIRKVKLEKALPLLKEEHTSLTNVAYECGFFDQSHFIKSFKEATGFLPKYYKNL